MDGVILAYIFYKKNGQIVTFYSNFRVFDLLSEDTFIDDSINIIDDTKPKVRFFHGFQRTRQNGGK